MNIKTIQYLIKEIDISFKDNIIKKKELEHLKKYISKSDLYKGKKRKIYSLINRKKKDL